MGIIALRLSDDLDARVRREADARSCSISELLRDAVRIEIESPRLAPAAPDEPPRAIRLVREIPAEPPPRPARTASPATRTHCVHRVSSGRYCRRCKSLIA